MSNNKQNTNRSPHFGHRGMGAGMSGEKPKNFKGAVKKIINYLKPYKWPIFVVILFSIGSAIFYIVGPKILGEATTVLFEGLVEKVSGVEGAGIDFTKIGKILLFLLGLYLISALFSFVQNFIMAGVAQKVSFNLRKSISEKINRIPIRYFDKTNNGEVISRITNDVDLVSQTLDRVLSDAITAVTTIIGILIMMFSINVPMTLVSIILLPLSMILLGAFVKKSQKHFENQQKYLGNINGHIEEMYGAHNIVKAYNGEEKSIEKFNEINDKLYTSAWKAQFLSGMMIPVISFVGNVGYVLIAILGGWYAANGKIKVGDILAFVQYVRSFMQPIAQTASITSSLQSTVAAAERVFEFLEVEEEEKEESKNFNLEKIKGEIVFENVKFGYDPDKIIIKDFSLKVKPGQKIAIVGPTGAGKTTIVKLLMRFYELNGGSIYVDGINTKDINREDLRSIFGMVLQDTWLFNGTIMENIRYGKLDASDDEVQKAAIAANVDHFVHTLPDGYNMVLNEEANNISQGQKQLLTIARTILADPKILILDEATSSVDTRTEVLIQKAMKDLMKDRTSFIIAHRLSTIRDADTIIVMKDGSIVETGNHDELYKANGFYRELYDSQFEGE